MVYRGYIRNGQVTLDEPVELPEGARVHVDLIDDRQSLRDVMLRMPLEQRRAMLRRQSGQLAGHYESDADMAEWLSGMLSSAPLEVRNLENG